MPIGCGEDINARQARRQVSRFGPVTHADDFAAQFRRLSSQKRKIDFI
jgi:hypothetical protein